ncbi:hypothetical protein [Actinacidiphila glaucinigra]|uniref:Uncharacterized protein n=1 Tax=Actinacidiphila glaucinigra TaxID=235986 RepID=A0A239LUQ4_9ACTN|nr:hypothetical protein [Actinacidiphila glaucinigra]SNT33990.1 hypothetical protein SAMN05216252_12188 [Actinacidiphila glaucinigra]
MATTDAPLTATRPAVPARAGRSVVWALIAASLAVKSAGFSWDFLGYYVATAHGTTAAGASMTLFGVG